MNWKNKHIPILARCSALGQLATEPRDKSPMEKYKEANDNLIKYKNDYSIMVNKETATAKKKLEQIQKTNNLILELEPIKDKPHLSQSCIKQMIKLFITHEYGRRQRLNSKYLEKGNEQEEDSITLLSLYTGRLYKKNTERLSDTFKTGECDLYEGKNTTRAEHTLDTKSSWSMETFMEAIADDLNHDYECQGQGYMDLYNADRHSVCYCLVNGSGKHILDEKKKLAYSLGLIDMDAGDENFKKECQLIERNHIFDMGLFLRHNPWFELHSELDQYAIENGEPWEYDVPYQQRVHIKTFERNQAKMEFIHHQIEQGREYILTNFYK
jgi:hypothetical protein